MKGGASTPWRYPLLFGLSASDLFFCVCSLFLLSDDVDIGRVAGRGRVPLDAIWKLVARNAYHSSLAASEAAK